MRLFKVGDLDMVGHLCNNWIVDQDMSGLVHSAQVSRTYTILYCVRFAPFQYPLVLVDSDTLEGRNALRSVCSG